jgi:hypothetical protein
MILKLSKLEREDVNWIQLAQGSVQWRALVNRIFNI